MKRIALYIKIWWMMSRNAFLTIMTQKSGLLIFLIGKVLRFTFFFAFIYFILTGAEELAGYSLGETIFFFLTFNLIDVITQFLYREVYRFRPLIISGNFDLILVKPVSPLFRSLFGGADIVDLITIPPLFFAVFWAGRALDPSFSQVLMYILLLLNGLIISTAFHITVLALGIITLEIDHTIMIYRDLVALGRFPIDIYKEPLRFLITFIIPVGLMVTFPAKALFGFISLKYVLALLLLGFFVLVVSVKFWKYSLTRYTSASS